MPVIVLDRGADGNGIIANPGAPQNDQVYQLNYGENDGSTPLPYFGFIFEF